MNEAPLVAVLMGSRSDWDTMEHAVETLQKLEIPHEVRVLSAHRTPDALESYVSDAESRGAQVFIAAAALPRGTGAGRTRRVRPEHVGAGHARPYNGRSGRGLFRRACGCAWK